MSRDTTRIAGVMVLAIFALFGVLLGPTIISAAAGVDAQINCFIGATSLNAIIPFIYYGGIAMLTVGGVGIILRTELKRGMMTLVLLTVGGMIGSTYRRRLARPVGAGVTTICLLAMIVGILSLGTFAPWGFGGNGSVLAAETTCLLLDGSTTMTGNLDMGSNDIVNNANITSSGTSQAALFTGGAFQSTGTVHAQTIDATGDFTIDGLVITPDTITNDATLSVDAVTAIR